MDVQRCESEKRRVSYEEREKMGSWVKEMRREESSEGSRASKEGR